MFDPSTATVFSICPFPITAHKPGLSPGHFLIPASVDGELKVLNVKSSTFPVYLDSDRGSMRVSCSAYDVARSIKEDYVTSSLGIAENAAPGIFFVEGIHTPDKLTPEIKAELEQARVRQMNWFMNLIHIADDEWQKTHRHAAISDMQRVALREMNKLREKANQKPFERDWLIVPLDENLPDVVSCPACGTILNNDPILCPTCKFVRKVKEYEAMKSSFAGVK